MQTYVIKKIGFNKGAPRIWIEGKRVAKAGFEPGARYQVKVGQGSYLVLQKMPNGTRVVSRKGDDDDALPVIDLNSYECLHMFEGLERVRVVMRDGEIHISALDVDIRAKERVERLTQRIATGDPIQVGSTSHGAGVLSLAIHEGLAKAGLKSELAFANEIHEPYIEHASNVNPAWGANTIYAAAPMQEFAFDRSVRTKVPQLDIVEAGIPCIAASVAGRAKGGFQKPEDSEVVGHLVVGFLNLIALFNPAVIALENVVPYRDSASMSIIRTTLKEWGYTIHETVISGADFNVLEDRKRMVMIAVTKGLDFDFSKIQFPSPATQRLADVLEDVPLDDPSWSEMAGLKAKELRDKEAGKGFAMQIYTGEESRINTLTAGLQKGRSTDPKIQHPLDPNLLRIPTPAEHAACKGVPLKLVEGLCKTTAHEVLGQSIIFPAFVEVGRLIGQCMKNGFPLEQEEEEFRLVA